MDAIAGPVDFSAIYMKYGQDVFRFVFYLSGNREDAEDITSETFVRAFASSGKIEMPTVKAYLFAIARNLFLMGLRSGHRRRVGDEEGVERADTAPGPLELFEQRAALGAVWGELQKIPEPDRTALLMRSLDGMPYEEIAQTLKISVSSAKVKVHRARALLMKKHQGGLL
ncbi:MAG: sigma-70 family RNA polymerase sigma factor [Bryobacteraceae bacterium]